MTEPAPLRGAPSPAESPPASYAGRTRYTQLEYDALLANLSIGIAFTRERRFFLCNARFAAMLGYGPDELIGQPGEVICASPASYAALGEIAGPLISRGGQLDVEWELKRKDGSTFVARLVAKSLDPESPQQGTVWIVEDITEQAARRRRAARACCASRRRSSPPRRSASCSSRTGASCAATGATRRCTATGPASSRASPPRCCTPTSRSTRKPARVYETLARGETSRRVELRRRKDGTTFWSRADGRAVDPRDPHRGAVWIVEDVTERRRAEEDLRRLVREHHETEERVQRALGEQELILDNAAVGIAFVRERTIQRCNRFLEEMVGAGPGELVGQSSAVLFASPADWEEAGPARLPAYRARRDPRRGVAVQAPRRHRPSAAAPAAGASTSASPSRSGSGAWRT